MEPIRLRQRLSESLKAALNAHDSIAVAALRSAMSAVDNAEAVDRSHAPADIRLGVGAGEVARRELSEEDAREIVQGEVRDRMAASAEYERLGRPEEARRLKAEATALLSFLEN